MFKLAILISLIIIKPTMAEVKITPKHVAVIQAIVNAADVAEVPRELMLAICWNESSFRTSKRISRMDGSSVSYGICQVKLITALYMDKVYKHKHVATSSRLNQVDVNAFYAAKVLKFQLKRYKGNWKRAIDAYNKGHAVSSKSVYVNRVMDHYKSFKVLTKVNN